MRQAPAPLQVPSLPQVAAPASVHWFSGSAPLGTLVQAPGVPASAQDRQVPVQAVPQQMPCSQKPELHSPAPPQAAPIGFRPQLLVLQTLGDAQSVAVEHVVLHAPVPQAYGAQLDVVAAWQVPVPLQLRAFVNVVPVHVAAAHCVPALYRRQAPLPLHVPSVLQADAPRSAHWFSGS